MPQQRSHSRRRIVAIATKVALALILAALAGVVVFMIVLQVHWVGGWESLHVVAAPPLAQGDRRPDAVDTKVRVSPEARQALLARARVFVAPPREGELLPFDDVSCTYAYRESNGSTPKFDCVRPNGEVLHVKYGRRNREAYTEVAATGLLSALGFAADRVFTVRSVHCYGCPPFPYPYAGPVWNGLFAARDGYRRFDFAVVERAMPGVSIRVHGRTGWGWDELEQIDEAKGGASRAEVDALRLMAVFLAHWDGKPSNQRLLCPDGDSRRCETPVVMLQDVGATFGRRKMNLPDWRSAPIWEDASRCAVTMKSDPFAGGSFVDREISERGRALLVARLRRLNRDDVAALFRTARFEQFPGRAADADIAGWVEAFERRRRQIAEVDRCPTP